MPYRQDEPYPHSGRHDGLRPVSEPPDQGRYYFRWKDFDEDPFTEGIESFSVSWPETYTRTFDSEEPIPTYLESALELVRTEEGQEEVVSYRSAELRLVQVEADKVWTGLYRIKYGSEH